MRVGYGAGVLMLCAGIFLSLTGAFHQRPNTEPLEAETNSAPVLSTDAEYDSGKTPEITFEDILRGESFGVTDEDLRDWIRENRGSEAAWLVAYSSRWSLEMNDWQAAGLKAHPESRPLVLSAAVGELWPLYSGASESRVWIDRFLAIDPGNGAAWFLSALAHYYRGEFDRGDEHLVRASAQSGIRLYSTRFEEASYEFGKANDHSEAVASLMSDAAAPTLYIPKLMEVIKDIQLRADVLRESGLQLEADRLDEAGYQLGNLFFERDVSDDNRALSPIIGVEFNKKFKDRVPTEVVAANFETEQRMEAFLGKWKEYRQQKDGSSKMTEPTYQAWHDFRRYFGETEALQFLLR